MSHVIEHSPESINQKIRHLGALFLACQNITTKSGKPALELRLQSGTRLDADGHLYDRNTGKKVTAGVSHYRTWKDDHNGRLVGDWPTPKGMTSAQVGENAIAVIALTEAGKAELSYKPSASPYEAGVIPHVDEATGELTYAVTHDFFSGGYGLEEYVGKTVLNQKSSKSERVESAHGDLLMHYQMMAAKIAAEEAGHSIEFSKQEDGTYTAVVDKEHEGVTA